MKITSNRGLFGSLFAYAMLAGGAINAMGTPSRRVLNGAAQRARGTTQADVDAIAAAKAKRERRAERNRRNGLTK